VPALGALFIQGGEAGKGGGGGDRKEKKNKVELGQGPRKVCTSTTNFLLFHGWGEKNEEEKVQKASWNQTQLPTFCT
jgi:hypothetical protein